MRLLRGAGGTSLHPAAVWAARERPAPLLRADDGSRKTPIANFAASEPAQSGATFVNDPNVKGKKLKSNQRAAEHNARYSPEQRAARRAKREAQCVQAQAASETAAKQKLEADATAAAEALEAPQSLKAAAELAAAELAAAEEAERRCIPKLVAACIAKAVAEDDAAAVAARAQAAAAAAAERAAQLALRVSAAAAQREAEAALLRAVRAKAAEAGAAVLVLQLGLESRAALALVRGCPDHMLLRPPAARELVLQRSPRRAAPAERTWWRRMAAVARRPARAAERATCLADQFFDAAYAAPDSEEAQAAHVKQELVSQRAEEAAVEARVEALKASVDYIEWQRRSAAAKVATAQSDLDGGCERPAEAQRALKAAQAVLSGICTRLEASRAGLEKAQRESEALEDMTAAAVVAARRASRFSGLSPPPPPPAAAAAERATSKGASSAAGARPAPKQKKLSKEERAKKARDDKAAVAMRAAQEKRDAAKKEKARAAAAAAADAERVSAASARAAAAAAAAIEKAAREEAASRATSKPGACPRCLGAALGGCTALWGSRFHLQIAFPSMRLQHVGSFCATADCIPLRRRRTAAGGSGRLILPAVASRQGIQRADAAPEAPLGARWMGVIIVIIRLRCRRDGGQGAVRQLPRHEPAGC